MNGIIGGYEHLLNQIKVWAASKAEVRAAVKIGSRARRDLAPDQWADLDIGLLVVDPLPYLESEEWLAQIGDYWCTHVETTEMSHGLQRRVVFADGLNVDFIFYGLADLEAIFTNTSRAQEIASSLRRGIEILVDKDNIIERSSEILLSSGNVGYKLPKEPDFAALMSKFWYHVIWAAKHIRRGELWRAHVASDGDLKRLLLQMIEWHAHTTHGEAYETWSDGRFLEQWAEPGVLLAINETFARHEQTDLTRALLATAALFHRLSQETANQLGYTHLIERHERLLLCLKEIIA